ncbi:MAG: PAS domain S-box protein [Syntrophales bacterium]|jgi:PAS domain S-box-containing protein
MKDKPRTQGQRMRELESERDENATANAGECSRRDSEGGFPENESLYHYIMDHISDGVYRINEKGYFTFVNRVIVDRAGISAEKFCRLHFLDLVMPEYREMAKNNFEKVMRGEEGVPYELTYRRSDGQKNIVEVHSRAIYEGSRVTGILGISREITERKRAEAALREAYDHLDLLVAERTQELQLKNRELMKEIAQRRKMEEALTRRETDLEEKTSNLEELNTALKVLLKQRDRDKREFEEWVVANVENVIMPYVGKLKKSGLGPEESAYVKILDTNLRHITSSFLHRLSPKYMNLTFRELQITDLVKEGNSSKDVAAMLNVSERTVDFHRKNIRKKLAIVDRKTNLRTYLSRLS